MRRLLVVAPWVFLGCSGSSSSPATPSQPVTAAQCATLLPMSASIPAGATTVGAYIFTVITTPGDSVRCTWAVSTTDAWISAVAPTSGTGFARVSYKVTGNLQTTAPRIGSILLAWAGGSTRFTVNQAGASCTPSYTIQVPAISFSQYFFDIGPGCFGNTTFAIDVSWLHDFGTVVSGDVFIGIDANPGAPRTGHLTMSGINGNGLSAQYTFVQAGP